MKKDSANWKRQVSRKLGAPQFAVLDWRKTLEFYTDLLGFVPLYDRPDEGFVFLKLGDAQIMIYQANLERNLVTDNAPLQPPLGRGVNLQIQVASIRTLVNALTQAQIPLVLEPEERQYRVRDEHIFVRQFAVADPDGYLLRFSERIGS